MIMNVGQILLIVIGFLFFGLGVCNAQVSVIHFNSDWNTDNSFDISTLNDCDTQNVIICNEPVLKDKHNIISVPTIIVFDEDEEVKRFQANIMMELTCTKKDIQKEIDKILLKRFE
tara:strand:- start:6824 stop:7171 length:348 start_codon:yes stop_codon:yes gene_type:complete